MDCSLCGEAMGEFLEHLKRRHPITNDDSTPSNSETHGLLEKCLELAQLAEAAGSRLAPTARDDLFSQLQRTINFFLGLQTQTGQLRALVHLGAEFKPEEDALTPSPTSAASQLGSGDDERSLVSTQAIGPEAAGSVELADGFCQRPRSSVLYLIGLHLYFDCDRLFNLVCLYGNVIRIKLLLYQMGASALVEMESWQAAQRCIKALDGIFVFGRQIRVSWSKNTSVIRSPGNTHFKEFRGSSLNRFRTPSMSSWSQTRANPPNRHLAFFRSPPDLIETDIRNIFERSGATQPKCININPNSNGTRCYGFIHFESAVAATEALVFSNHASVGAGTQGSWPFQLSFGTPTESAELMPPVSPSPSWEKELDEDSQ